MSKMTLVGALAALVVMVPEVGGAAQSGDMPGDPSAWGSYQGLRVPTGDFRLPKSLLPVAPKSGFSVDAASANNEGGVVRFHYAPNFKDPTKESALRAVGQPPVGGRSGFSFYGQLGDPRYGLKGAEGFEGLTPSDRPGGFILDVQRDFRRYPGLSLGVGYDF
ncbi:MAG: hypothetical protein MUF80_03640 [Burkholderiales bacterium]|nr:hypothetical protein [Burkholderiales bacterium]